MQLVYLFMSINALTIECMWHHIARLNNNERKHVSLHGATRYGPSPSGMRKRDIPLEEEKLQELGG